MSDTPRKPMRFFPWVLTVGGAIGLFASATLTWENLKLLQNSAYVPSCSLNPVISCGSVMKTAEASAFGFPNSWLGLAAFTAVMVVGVSMFAGAKFKSWYWRLFNIGTLLGVTMITWLFSQSVYSIHALCPWCIVVWTVTIPIFLFTTIFCFHEGHWPLHPRLEKHHKIVHDYKFLILVIWYLIIAGAILQHFWYYFKTVI